MGTFRNRLLSNNEFRVGLLKIKSRFSDCEVGRLRLISGVIVMASACSTIDVVGARFVAGVLDIVGARLVAGVLDVAGVRVVPGALLSLASSVVVVVASPEAWITSSSELRPITIVAATEVAITRQMAPSAVSYTHLTLPTKA